MNELSDDGTVTDGEVEQFWYCYWRQGGEMLASPSELGEPRASVMFEGRGVSAANAHMFSVTKPTPEQFHAHVLAETGVKVECFEKEEWHLWDGEGWSKPMKGTAMPAVWRDKYGNWMATFYSKRSERTEKRDALLAAARAAGKPEDEA